MKDLAGKRFGRLVAVEPTCKRSHGRVVWRCRCDCGNTCEVTATALTSGNTRSCGCLKRDVHRVDLTGQRFGRLVAEHATDKRVSSSVVWHCRCDCGNTCDVPATSLTSGNTRSCGCLKGGEGAPAAYRDLAGQRFGKLVALYPAGRRNGSVVWHCQCDCGNEKDVASSLLTSGKTRSCGCMRADRARPEGRAYDLTGQQFGELVAVERIGARNRYALWNCRCSCGNEFAATSRDLRTGKVRDCGGSAHGAETIVVPGRRFGELTAVNKTDELDEGSPVWRCLCDCDRGVKCSERDLRCGHITSCGKCH